PWRADSSSWNPRYSSMYQFDERTILTSDIFTQAAEMRNMGANGDIVSHSALYSMAIGKGDGSVFVKKSKGLIATIRSGNWESSFDLNRMSQLLVDP
ncbi:MAG: hypothetical protein NE327_17130, partial [Lentisphaeraceae bacterium]|nr:hypothetical protein [Lentisphaeraceae bacterium]